MTAPPDTPAPDDGDPGGASQPEGGPGVELGMSDEPGGTFEPEEDPDTGS
jgi:hypothetical protein